MSLTLAAIQACTTTPGTTTPGSTSPHTTTQAPRTSAAAPQVTAMTKISAGCPGNSSEVEEAFAPPSYIYAEWIGCGGIGFARSTDFGQHFAAAMTVPGSRGFSWDPAITVAADGTVYAAFMHSATLGSSTSYFPVVAVSHDHGLTFAQVHRDLPPVPGNWGDRDFIAAGPAGQLYLTWDYGPSLGAIKTLCAKGGSCAFSSGDLNAVIQTSSDGGATWGPITHLEPGFPLGGGYGAPLVARPDGSIDVLYNAHPTDQGTEKLHPGYEYFTSSTGGTNWPASPARLWPAQGTLSLTEWWIDGDISTDTAGNLYVTWDTQTPAGDIGWLTYSRDGGRNVVRAAAGHAGHRQRPAHRRVGRRPAGSRLHRLADQRAGAGLRHLPAPVLHRARLDRAGDQGVRRVRRGRHLARRHLRHLRSPRRPHLPDLGQRCAREHLGDLRLGGQALRVKRAKVKTLCPPDVSAA